MAEKEWVIVEYLREKDGSEVVFPETAGLLSRLYEGNPETVPKKSRAVVDRVEGVK